MAIPNRHSDASSTISNCRTFFVTSSIAEKRRLLQSNRSADLLVRILYEYRSQEKFRLHEFVVMPDHVHVLLSVDSRLTVEKAVQLIKGGFSFRAGREFGFTAPVWQRGFSDQRIRDGLAYSRVAEYIRNNPVAARLVREVAAFPFSSAYPGFELDPIPQGLKPESLFATSGTAEAVP